MLLKGTLVEENRLNTGVDDFGKLGGQATVAVTAELTVIWTRQEGCATKRYWMVRICQEATG